MNNADQPAFPAMDMNQYSGVDRLELKYEGLTKREYFAAIAMQGFCNRVDQLEISARQISAWSIQQADELLQQLEITKPKT